MCVCVCVCVCVYILNGVICRLLQINKIGASTALCKNTIIGLGGFFFLFYPLSYLLLFSHSRIPSYPLLFSLPSYVSLSHSLIPFYSHTFIPAYPRTIIFSYPHTFVPSYPHTYTLIVHKSYCLHTLVSSYPCNLAPLYLIPSYPRFPYTLIPSYPHTHTFLLSHPHTPSKLTIASSYTFEAYYRILIHLRSLLSHPHTPSKLTIASSYTFGSCKFNFFFFFLFLKKNTQWCILS